MKSNALVTLLRCSESTIRKYAGDYADYLSPLAQAGAGRHRDYTDHDARVLKLVIDMKAAKQTEDSIHATLRSLQANGWERLPALDNDALAVVPSPAAMLAVQTERAVMQKEIDLLREQIERAEAVHKDERTALTADRDELVKKLAEAETMIKLYESGRLKPPTG